jgi:hypothetical protein
MGRHLLPLQPLRPRVVAGQPLEPTGPGELFPQGFPSIMTFFHKCQKECLRNLTDSYIRVVVSWIVLLADG